MVTGKLAGDPVAHRRLMPGVGRRRSRCLNSWAENSPQLAWQRERAVNASDPLGAPNGSCLASAPYHRTSGSVATDSPQSSTDSSPVPT